MTGFIFYFVLFRQTGKSDGYENVSVQKTQQAQRTQENKKHSCRRKKEDYAILKIWKLSMKILINKNHFQEEKHTGYEN